MIAEISIDSVLINMNNFHDCTFLNEKEILSLGPCIFDRVTEDFSFFEECFVLLVEFVGNRNFIRRILALI